MHKINLLTIFRHIVDDSRFLSTVVELDKSFEKKNRKKKGFSLMANMVTEYVPLALGETQNYSSFPNFIKPFLTPDFVRMGVKNITEKNLTAVNISFLNSLNMLLRPDLVKASQEEQMRNLSLLEDCVSHMIHRNYRIDKVKNTKRVQNINKALVNDMQSGKITHDLIQSIVNIFEINLLVFDLATHEVLLYWAFGHKFPYFNLFRNVYCMAFVRGNYEPIIIHHGNLTEETQCLIYSVILDKMTYIKCQHAVQLAPYAFSYINTWNIPPHLHLKIVNDFLAIPEDLDIDKEMDKVKELELHGPNPTPSN